MRKNEGLGFVIDKAYPQQVIVSAKKLQEFLNEVWKQAQIEALKEGKLTKRILF